MKKSILYFHLKIIFCIILFNVGAIVYAKPENKFETQFNAEVHDILTKSTNDLPLTLEESKIGVTTVLFSDCKKTNNIQSFKVNFYLEKNLKKEHPIM